MNLHPCQLQVPRCHLAWVHLLRKVSCHWLLVLLLQLPLHQPFGVQAAFFQLGPLPSLVHRQQ